VLGVATLCTAGYFWYELRPPPSLAQASPPPVAPATAPAAASGQIAASPVAPVAIPGLPSAPAAASPPPAATPSPPPAPANPPVADAKPRAADPPRRAPTPRPKPVPRAAALAAVPAAPRVHPKVDSGYAAYLAGDLATARTDYQQALRDDPGNRDALLGLAAIDMRTGRHESAEATYLRLLQADPNDAHAQASLIALRGAQLDPLATESRVKNLLAADPGANVLHFTLGNQLAQQGRWPEAQQEYFKAFAAYPENADFAYNLAVSLDHLRQPKLALEYYQRALALAERRGASFDLDAVRTRAAQLAH
jgi:Tfp pilus assembly protein PilF